jgi:TRAP-type C4-dicarboxylate transport system permease small subunit
MSATLTERRKDDRPLGFWQQLSQLLDKVYLWAGYASAACICLILLVTLSQIATRYLGINLPGISTYAGYLMAASTFLGLAHALTQGSHIRIETISKLFGNGRVYFDLFAFAVGSIITGWFAWYSCNMVHTTFVLQDVSTDNFLTLLLTRRYRFHASVQTV